MAGENTGGVDLTNRPDLFEAIFQQVMNIPEYGRTLYENWLANRYEDSVAEYFLANSDTLGTASPESVGYRQFLQAVKNSGGSLGFNSRDRLNTLGGLTAAKLDELQQEFDTDFSGVGFGFGRIQSGALANALRRNFGGRTSLHALNRFFSPRAIADYQLRPDAQAGGFLGSRLSELRARYGL